MRDRDRCCLRCELCPDHERHHHAWRRVSANIVEQLARLFAAVYLNRVAQVAPRDVAAIAMQIAIGVAGDQRGARRRVLRGLDVRGQGRVVVDRWNRREWRLECVLVQLLLHWRRQEIRLLLSIVRRHVDRGHADHGQHVEAHEEQRHPQEAQPLVRAGAHHIVQLQSTIARRIQAGNQRIRIALVLEAELLVDQQPTETP